MRLEIYNVKGVILASLGSLQKSFGILRSSRDINRKLFKNPIIYKKIDEVEIMQEDINSRKPMGKPEHGYESELKGHEISFSCVQSLLNYLILKITGGKIWKMK